MATPLDTLGDEYLAWQQERRQGIGASDVAGILGISPYASPYSVWADKVNNTIEEPTDEQRARWDAGHDAEHFLALQFQRHTGLYVACQQMRLQHPEHPWAFAHTDGLVFDGPTDEPTLDVAIADWDAKTANEYHPWDEPPAMYMAQMQYRLWITGFEVGYVTVGFSGWQTRTYTVERDEADIAMIAAECERFWLEHVLAETPPPVDGSDATARAIADSHPEHEEGESVDVPAELAERWTLAKANLDDAKNAEKATKNELAAAIGDAEFAVVNGERFASYRAQTRTVTCEACGHQSTSKPFRVLREAKQGRK